MDYTLKVPVRPHVKTYLEKRYGSPFVLTDRHPFGKYLCVVLGKPYFKQSYNDYLKSCTARLRVRLSGYSFLRRARVHLSGKMAYDFNVLVHRYMMEELFDYVDVSREFIPIRESIYRFIRKYGFAEDKEVTYYGFRKAYYRYRRAKKGVG